VQTLLTRARRDAGAVVVGRKVGLTSPAVQAQLGVDQPDFGVLFDDTACADDEPIDVGRLLQPRIEAEVAVILGADLDRDDIDEAKARASVAWVAPPPSSAPGSAPGTSRPRSIPSSPA
jgi:2-keto-4-pentenoate hydratase